MRTYKVKSIKRLFKRFTIDDNGLGYLDFNIHERIAEQRWGGLGKFIGSKVPDEDILVQPPNDKKWFNLVPDGNSSDVLLQHIHRTKTKAITTILRHDFQRF